MTSTDIVGAAAQAYIYGYPLVYNLEEIGKLPAGQSTIFGKPVPWNTFGPVRDLLDASAQFVTPNNDTLYLIAPLDLSGGPLVLHVPDTADRYYVLQFVDAWTNNFTYIGRRATGTAEARYLLTPAGYTGPVPDGVTAVEVPSTLAVIVGRTQVDGHDDLPAVHALQDQFTLRPLDDQQPAAGGLPVPDAAVPAALAFWEQLRVNLEACPPPAADAEFVGLLGKLGVNVDELVSGPLKGQPSVVKPLSPEGRAMLQGVVMDLYGQFVAMVASGRHMDVARVRELADGRPYTGHQAIGLGLVDQIGTEQDARAWLLQNRHIPLDMRISDLKQRPKGPWWRRQVGAVLEGVAFTALDQLVAAPSAKTLIPQGLVLDEPMALWQP